VKTLVIGDIHGCYNELQELLARSGIADSDAIIALGDIVDRGPESMRVLEFFRQQPNTRSLMGNHERKHVRASRGELKLAMSQVITRDQAGETYGEAVRYMNTFPLWIELPEAILVHGYLEPGILLENQKPTVLCGTMGGDRYMQSKYDRPWYELYHGSKPVIVGHLDYLKNGQAFVYQDRVIGLDTGCVYGKALTGLILPDFTIVSVPSHGDYWKVARMQYRQKSAAEKAKATPIAPAVWDEESEKILQKILGLVVQENQQVLARLREKLDFDSITPRQQAKAYELEVKDTPLAPLMHLARRGELDFERAKKILRNPAHLSDIAKKIGID
jgi:serine/threonine protein phosphatase 1